MLMLVTIELVYCPAVSFQEGGGYGKLRYPTPEKRDWYVWSRQTMRRYFFNKKKGTKDQRVAA
jgi:hypothetical protein